MTIAPPRGNVARPHDDSGKASVLGRLARFVLRHRRVVVVFWVIMLLAGGMSASRVSKRLSFDFSLPGQPGYETAARIIHTYGNGGDQAPDIVVVRAPNGTTVTSHEASVEGAFAAA